MPTIQFSLVKTSPEEFKRLREEAKMKGLDDGIQILEKSLRDFEEKYGMTSELFYQKITNLGLEESIDFIQWLGEYETYCELLEEVKVKELVGRKGS